MIKTNQELWNYFAIEFCSSIKLILSDTSLEYLIEGISDVISRFKMSTQRMHCRIKKLVIINVEPETGVCLSKSMYHNNTMR